MQYLLHGLQERIVKIIDIRHSSPWDEISIMKELDHPAIVKVPLFCFVFFLFLSCIASNISGRVCDSLSSKLLVNLYQSKANDEY